MKKTIAIIGIVFVLFMIQLYFVFNYSIVKLHIVTNKDSVLTKSFLLPNYYKLHIWKGRLQYTKTNGWHETIQFNVKSYKQIK